MERQRMHDRSKTLRVTCATLEQPASQAAGQPPQAPPAGRGIIDTRIEKPLVFFTGNENTRGDWSFKLRSYVSVVDLQLGRMMETAEQRTRMRGCQVYQ